MVFDALAIFVFMGKKIVNITLGSVGFLWLIQIICTICGLLSVLVFHCRTFLLFTVNTYITTMSFSSPAGSFLKKCIAMMNSGAAQKFSDKMGDLTSGISFSEAQGLFCFPGVREVFRSACSASTFMYYAGVFFIVFLFVSLFLDAIGAAYLHYYWKTGTARGMRFKSLYRLCAIRMLGISLLLSLIGIVLFEIASFNFLTTITDGPTGSIFGSASTNMMSGAIILIVFLLFRAVPLILIFNDKEYTEYDPEEEEDEADQLTGFYKYFPPLFSNKSDSLIPNPHPRKSMNGLSNYPSSNHNNQAINGNAYPPQGMPPPMMNANYPPPMNGNYPPPSNMF